MGDEEIKICAIIREIEDDLNRKVESRRTKISKLEKKIMGEDNWRLFMKTRETKTLKNRIERYARRLTISGLRNANKPYIELEQISEYQMDVTPLIEMAKDFLPSLYRRYVGCMEKYHQNIEDIRKMLDGQTS